MIERDVDYTAGDTGMRGLVVAPDGAADAPAVLLVHDAMGLSDEMIANARRIAGFGHPVFAADVWGDRYVLPSPSMIGEAVGAMAGDRPTWTARLEAARDAAGAQPEIDGARLVTLGFCFGGASALELLRLGADGVIGAVSIHGGLGLIGPDWSGAPAGTSVLVCTGADDPVATADERAALQQALDGAGIEWEVDLYSGTRHAFTSPSSAFGPQDAVGYNPIATARAWAATERFLAETLTPPPPSSKETP